MKCAIAQVMDTTGAGDCFTGAYAVAILEGKKPEEALTFAGVSPPLSCMLKPLLGHSGALFWALECTHNGPPQCELVRLLDRLGLLHVWVAMLGLGVC